MFVFLKIALSGKLVKRRGQIYRIRVPDLLRHVLRFGGEGGDFEDAFNILSFGVLGLPFDRELAGGKADATFWPMPLAVFTVTFKLDILSRLIPRQLHPFHDQFRPLQGRSKTAQN